MLLERERLMNVSQPHHAANFSKFLDSDDENEADNMSGGDRSASFLHEKARSTQILACTYCKVKLFNASKISGQIWTNNNGMKVSFCTKCNQDYISSQVDNKPENSKLLRYIQNLTGTTILTLADHAPASSLDNGKKSSAAFIDDQFKQKPKNQISISFGTNEASHHSNQ